MKTRYAVIIVLILFICIIFAGCQPDSRSDIEQALKSSLMVDYKFDSASKDKNEDGYVRKAYYFNDENEIEFNVTSEHRSGGSGGVPRKIDLCNYAVILLETDKEAVEKELQSDLSFEWSATNMCYGIDVYDYDDLVQASISIEKALNSVDPFPINRSEFSRYFEYYCLPTIDVYYPDKNLTLGEFHFLCDGETPLTQSQILDELQDRYKEKIEESSTTN